MISLYTDVATGIELSHPEKILTISFFNYDGVSELDYRVDFSCTAGAPFKRVMDVVMPPHTQIPFLMNIAISVVVSRFVLEIFSVVHWTGL